jgi:hypothetical protein
MPQADRSPIMSSPASGETQAHPVRRSASHRGHAAGHAAHQRHHARPGEKDWRKVADRGLEIVICIGHIVGVVMLVADHLF